MNRCASSVYQISDAMSRSGDRVILSRLIQAKESIVPEKAVVDKAKEDLKEGKSPSTAAGEFVHEEIEHVREGKHGVRSPQQAIAIGLSEARRAGIPLKAPSKGTSLATKKKAKEDTAAGKKAPRPGEKSSGKTGETSSTRSKATTKALMREPTNTVSHAALSKHAKKAAKKTTQRTTSK